MYDAVQDSYCYPGTKVLKNVPGLRRQRELRRFELAMTTQRFDEPLPGGRFSVSHYRAIHNHLFQDVYTWAGKFRTVRISKGKSPFCYPENIEKEMRGLFANLKRKRAFRGLPRDEFATQAAHFLAELNAIHPFRDGNGRAQLAFMTMLGDHAGYPIDLTKIQPVKFLAAMIASFYGKEEALEVEMHRLIARPRQPPIPIYNLLYDPFTSSLHYQAFPEPSPCRNSGSMSW